MKLKSFRVTLAAALMGVLASESAFAAEPQTVRQAVAIDTSRLSADLVSLGKLVQSGVDEKVVMTFIQNSPPRRNLTAEELVYLHELGLSSEAMVVLMNSVPKVSLTGIQPVPAPSSERLVEPLLSQRGYQPGGTAQAAQSIAAQAPVQSPPVAGNTVISSPAATVVYTQPAPATIYVEQPRVVYVEPVQPRVSFSFGFGHLFGHHGAHHWGRHHGGHHGGHWGGHGGGHGGH